jgi:hypothetical protein
MDLDEKSRKGKKIPSLIFTSCVEIDGPSQNFKIWGSIHIPSFSDAANKLECLSLASFSCLM